MFTLPEELRHGKYDNLNLAKDKVPGGSNALQKPPTASSVEIVFAHQHVHVNQECGAHGIVVHGLVGFRLILALDVVAGLCQWQQLHVHHLLH